MPKCTAVQISRDLADFRYHLGILGQKHPQGFVVSSVERSAERRGLGAFPQLTEKMQFSNDRVAKQYCQPEVISSMLDHVEVDQALLN
jgi:hypothetical protein